MKRTLILTIVAVSFIMLYGCGKKQPEQSKIDDAATKNQPTVENNVLNNQTNTSGSPAATPLATPQPVTQQTSGQQPTPSAVSQPKSTGTGKQNADNNQNQSGTPIIQQKANTEDQAIKSDNQPSKEETAKVFKELDKELEELENVLQQMDDVGEDTLDF